jgi:hypothetical protein
MNRGAWCAVACAAAGVLAVGVICRLGGLSSGPPGPRRVSVQLCGPNTGLIARMETKRRLAEEVIDGRRTLLEAAAAYRALDAEWTPCPGIIAPAPPPGVPEGEYYCRMVIDWVKGEAPRDRAKGAGARPGGGIGRPAARGRVAAARRANPYQRTQKRGGVTGTHVDKRTRRLASSAAAVDNPSLPSQRT